MLRVLSGLVLLAVIAGPVAGQDVEKDVAGLIKKLKDPKHPDFFKAQDCVALAHLADKSDKVVPFLLEMFADPKTETMAAKALGEVGPAAGKAAVPAMLALFRDVTKIKSREALAVSLSNLKPDPKEFLEALLIIAQDDGSKTNENRFATWQARAKTIDAIGNLGPAAKEAAPVLCALLKDGKVRADGLSVVPLFRALGKIEPDPKEVLPVIDAVVAEMKGTTPTRAVNIARVRISKDPELAAKVVQNIVAVYKGQKGEPGGPNNRNEAMQDIEELGPLVKPAVLDIAPDLENANGGKRQETLRLLVKLGPDVVKESLPLIIKSMSNKDVWEPDVVSFLENLPRLGADPKDVLNLAIAVMEDYVAPDGKYAPNPDKFPKPWQGDVLGKIREMGPNGAAAAPAVVKVVEYHLNVNKKGGGTMIIQAIQTLGEMGPGASAAAMPLLGKIRVDQGLQFTADEAIKKIKTGVAVKPPDNPKDPKDPMRPKDPVKPALDEEKVKVLVAGLKDPVAAKRKEAIIALAGAGPTGRIAQPALVELLRDPDREIRLLAAYALERLETGK
jgi:HEAT repeat protein